MSELRERFIYDKYKVDTNGDVYSLEFKNPYKQYIRKKPLLLKKCNGAHGYYTISFSVNNKKILKPIHVLVLETFVGPRPKGHYAVHLDGNKHNNKLSNLKWGTPKENQSHRYKHGTACYGEKNPSARLNAKQVKEIRKMKAEGIHIKEIMSKYNMAKSTLYRIISRSLWPHI